MKSLDDEPILSDALSRSAVLRRLGDELIMADAPKVYGVHGEWGSGKTSFLCQLQFYISGNCNRLKNERDNKQDKSAAPLKQAALPTIWFEAWHYQHESSPVVALLHEIRNQLSLTSKTWNKLKKLSEVQIKSMLLGLESLTKYIGVKAAVVQAEGEAWEKRHFETPLTTQEIRKQLEHVIDQVLGKGQKLVIFIDDLDRCESSAAFRLLEGLKVYLNMSNVIYVLGMDQRQVERIIAKELGNSDTRLAREYLEKICQDIIHLPLIQHRDQVLDGFLQQLDLGVKLRQALVALVQTDIMLPANPRKLKAFANVIARFNQVGLRESTFFETELERKAGILLLVAGLYYFHPDIYRQLEQDGLRFYNELLLPLAGGHLADHPAFKGLRLPAMESEFPHPSENEYFRLTKLLARLQNLEPNLLHRFLETDHAP
jgi:hypothetical protein